MDNLTTQCFVPVDLEDSWSRDSDDVMVNALVMFLYQIFQIGLTMVLWMCNVLFVSQVIDLPAVTSLRLQQVIQGLWRRTPHHPQGLSRTPHHPQGLSRTPHHPHRLQHQLDSRHSNERTSTRCNELVDAPCAPYTLTTPSHETRLTGNLSSLPNASPSPSPTFNTVSFTQPPPPAAPSTSNTVNSRSSFH
jgi:hypothetical protein